MDFLDLLTRVENPDKRMEKILGLELDFDILLPPILKLFFQLYEGGRYMEKTPYWYYSESTQRTREFYEIIPGKNAEFFIYEFMPLSEIRSNMIAVYPKDHRIWNEKLIPIAETSGQGYILVSVENETCDQVFIDFQEEDEMKFLANNIFELLMNVKVNFLDKKIKDGKVQNLYKNWGENFWRINPNNT